ncbi:hypothetical protein Pan44_10460 [Caulifigura coniformis]|uniref:Uncharacterized protein n=1 Tax=Caulifigura coniformis TaxID=2527983 RepID=A0A517SA78_9PLAN|nr:hypothetical protein [Caulifigura coniformis]QDT53031.1 hypothetical protein Pan44_10460 [Caulifigura coniformis]
MSKETENKLFEGLRTAASVAGQVVLGTLKDIASDVGQEGARQLRHGASEIASLPFTGHGYVQYGRDQDAGRTDTERHGVLGKILAASQDVSEPHSPSKERDHNELYACIER